MRMVFKNEEMIMSPLPSKKELEDDLKLDLFLGDVSSEMRARGYSWIGAEGNAYRTTDISYDGAKNQWSLKIELLALKKNRWEGTGEGIIVTVKSA